MFKKHTTRFGTDPIDRIEELRKEFPNSQFVPGMWKQTKGIFVLHDLETRTYGEHYELDNGDTFWSPSDLNILKIRDSLSSFKTAWTDRIKVKLKTGLTIEVYPASAIPKKVMLSLRKKQTEEEKETPYNKNMKYGRMAYDFFFRSQRDEEIRFDSDDFQNFVRQALVESYTLPIEVWDSLEVISMGDFDPIYAAAMGYDYEMLQREIPLSNGQPA